MRTNSTRLTWRTSRSPRDFGGSCGRGRCRPTARLTPSRTLADFDLHRHAHLDLLGRAWALKENITAYDAMYVALAEALGAAMITCDAALATASGHRARVEVIAGA
jgi:hypothetical protein